MNEHDKRQTERKHPSEEEAERTIAGINLLQQTMGSAECVLIRTCLEKYGERKRSDYGNRKGIIKRALYTYKVKKFMLKRKII